MVAPGQEYPISDYARLFPEMGQEGYRQLVDSIRQRGLLEPIALWQGQIIDGRHRLRACTEAGVTPHYVHLDPDTEPVGYVLAMNLDRRHLDESQRALVAHQLSCRSRPGGDRRSADYQHQTDHSADLPNGLTQQQAAELLHVSPRLVRDAGRIMADDGPASPALQQAVTEGRIRVSDARPALTQPVEVQEQALERVASGRARNLSAALRQIKRERYEAEEPEEPEDLEKLAANRSRPLDETVTLHQAALAHLHLLVDQASVDLIITHPPHGPEALPRLAHQAAFAAHALGPDGVLVVISGMERLPDTLEQLKRPDLPWVAELDYRDNMTANRSGPPHRIQLRRRPLLVYGKPGCRLPPGHDVIELPPSVEGTPELRAWQRNNAGLELISQRFARPGQVLCDPWMLGRASAALAARKLGCSFIGADQEATSVSRVRRYLQEGEA